MSSKPLYYRLKLIWVRYGDLVIPAAVTAIAVVVFLALIFIHSLSGDISHLNREVEVINHYLHITKTIHTKTTTLQPITHHVTKIISGPRGARGIRGVAGVAGHTGTQGPRGAQGPQGVQGPQGKTGPRGPRGSIGVRGLPGIPGTSVNVDQVIAALCSNAKLSTLCGMLNIVH
jgi:hypothetical protein